MIDQLDIRSLLLVITLILVCRSGLLLYVWLLNRDYRPIRYWAMGSCVMAVGVLLLGNRETIPLYISVLAGQGCVITGWLLISAGTLMAADRKPPWVAGVTVAVASLVVASWFLFITPRYFERTIAVTLPGLVFDTFVALSCVRSANCGRRSTTLRTLAGVLVVTAITGILKNAHVYHAGTSSLFETSWEMGLYYLSVILGLVVCTVLYVLLAAQKVQEDLDIEIDTRQRNEKSMQMASLVFQNTGEAIMVTDADGRIVDINPAFTALTGFDASEVMGQTARILKSGRQEPQFYTDMWRAISQTGAWNGELWNCRKDGSAFASRLLINTLHDADGSPYRRVAMLHDITQQRLSNERVLYQASHDPLTGLVNRQYFLEQLAVALSRARRHNTQVGLAYLDLNQFKPVNDNYGHEAGDLVLKTVANRWARCVRADDVLARLGGDEFALLIGGVGSREAILPIADKLLQAVAAPIELDANQQCAVGASMGIAFYPDHAAEMDSLMAAADAAMYQCKFEKRGGYVISDVQPGGNHADHDWLRFGPSDLIGVGLIDTQHRQLVRMVNDLNRAIVGKGGDAELKTMFLSLITFAAEHFETEHRLMAEHGYPGLSEHDAQHDKLTEELRLMLDRFSAGDELQLLQKVKDWLMGHIHHCDMPMGSYLRAKGLS